MKNNVQGVVTGEPNGAGPGPEGWAQIRRLVVTYRWNESAVLRQLPSPLTHLAFPDGVRIALPSGPC